MTTTDCRPSPDRYPTGWFAVAFSSDIGPGDVKPVRYFGRELVLFRTLSGRACVSDAYCPHMGAHLGVGGRVNGESLRCPFHGWTFSADGDCTGAPCRDEAPRARLSMWHARERNRVVLVWHDVLGRAPDWDVPEHPEPQLAQFAKQILLHEVRAQVRDVFENIVDLEHFHAVHGTRPVLADRIRVDPDHPQRLSVLASTGASETPQDFAMDAMLIGPGHGRAEGVAWGFPQYRAYNTFYATPVDDTTLDIRSVCRLLADVSDADVIETLSGVAQTAGENVRGQLEADILIWQNKRRDRGPGGGVLIDPHVTRFRRWYEQFYPRDLRAAAVSS